MGVLANGKAADLEEAAESGKEWEDVKDDESAGQGLFAGSIAGYVVGGAAVTAGAVLLVLDSRKESERRAWIAPGVTPGGAVLSGGFRF